MVGPGIVHVFGRSLVANRTHVNPACMKHAVRERELSLYHEHVGKAVIESGLRWKRLRAPPVNTSS